MSARAERSNAISHDAAGSAPALPGDPEPGENGAAVPRLAHVVDGVGVRREVENDAVVVEGRLAKVRQKPVFLYFHLMDPHSPYDSGRLKRGTPKDRYVSEIAGVGERLRKLDDWLEDRGIAERVVLIVTADHGEAFGEHGTHQHSKTLYDELLRVPLFIRLPGVSSRRVDEPVSLIDIGPTILDLMGVATPGQYMGQSLVPFLRGESPTLTRPIVAEAHLIQTIVFPDGMKPIRDLRKGTQELYDLKSDPAEEHNLIDGATGPHLELLERFFDEQTHPSYEKHAPYRP